MIQKIKSQYEVILRDTLGAETFASRNFREIKKIAKFLTKTFANSNFWDEFRVKNFRKNQKTLHLQGKKLSRMATIFFFCRAEVYKY